MNIEKKNWWIKGVGTTYSEDQIGQLGYDDFSTPPTAFSSDWTRFGANLPTVSGGNAVFQDGSGTSVWTKGVNYNIYDTNLHTWKIVLGSVVLTSAKASNTFGIGVGMKSIANRGNPALFGVGAYYDTSTGANGGKLIIGKVVANTATFTQLAISGGTLTYSTNDVLTITLEHLGFDITFTVLNNTTSQSLSVSYSYDFTYPVSHFQHNISNPCIWSLGNGITNVSSMTLTSTQYQEVDYAFIGDSILHGYYAELITNRFPEKTFTGSLSTRRHVNLGGLSHVTNDYSSDLNDLAVLQVNKAVVIQVGTNDVEHKTLANYQTQMTNIVNLYRSNNLGVVLCKLLPRNDGLDVRSFNDWLDDTYGPGGTAGFQLKIVDLFTAFRDSGYSGDFDGNPAYYVDTVHPNITGYTVMGNTLNADLIEFEAGDLS